MPCVIEQNVLGLQVSAPTRQQNSGHAGHEDSGAPVDDVEPVEVLKRTEQLGRVEPTPALVELALTLQVVEELSSVDEPVRSVKTSSGSCAAPKLLTRVQGTTSVPTGS